MAIYHLTTKLIRRSQGQSAVAAAAYRAGDELWDEQLQKLFDYSRRHGVDQTDIVLPSLAQHEWAKDRETLWNAAEHAGRHPRAQVARELELALPHELTVSSALSSPANLRSAWPTPTELPSTMRSIVRAKRAITVTGTPIFS